MILCKVSAGEEEDLTILKGILPCPAFLVLNKIVCSGESILMKEVTD